MWRNADIANQALSKPRPLRLKSLTNSATPILPDETEFKLKHGYDELMDRLLSREVSDVIDLQRWSAVARRGWWPFGK